MSCFWDEQGKKRYLFEWQYNKMKLKFSGFYGDIIVTLFSELVVLIGFFFTYRLLAVFFGPEGVGEYVLVKRVVGLFLPFLFLGLGVGLSRYLAVVKNRTQRNGYLQAGGYSLAFFTSLFIIFINLFQKEFASFVFGSPAYSRLVVPFSMMLAGVVFHSLVYSYFRGLLKVKAFNLLQIINLGLVPILVIFSVQGKNIEALIFATGLWTFIVVVVFFTYFIKSMVAPVVGRLNYFKELMIYSLPRFGGDLILAALFSFGPIIAVHVMAIKEVGFFSLSQSLLSSAGAVIVPLGLVLLPKVSNMVAEGREDLLKKNIDLLMEAVIQCSIFLCGQLVIFSDSIVLYWLGRDFVEAVPAIQITFFALLFYNFYVMFRSILDAVKTAPINTINLGISLVVFIGLSFLMLATSFFSALIGLSIAFTATLVCLGLLTYYSVRKIYPEYMAQDAVAFKTAVILNVLIIPVTFSVKAAIGGSICTLIAYEGIVLGIYLAVLYRLKVKWVMEVMRLLGWKNEYA